MTCASGWLILSRMQGMRCLHCRRRVSSVRFGARFPFYIVMHLANGHCYDRQIPTKVPGIKACGVGVFPQVSIPSCVYD
jgi:hypothetical protein